MSNGTFVVSLVIGAAVLALWIDARFPVGELEIKKILGHALVAVALLYVIPASGGSSAVAFTLVFALVLPALVYMCLTTVWFVRFAQASLGLVR